MAYHQHPPISRRRLSSVEETRYSALETIKLTWTEINHMLKPLGDVVIVLDNRRLSTLEPVPQIVRDLQSVEVTNKLNSLFDKVISSLAAAVARIQLRNSPLLEDEESIDFGDSAGSPEPSSAFSTQSSVILLEDDVLEYVISENVLLKTLGYATHPHLPDNASLILRWNLLRILETLVSSCLKDPRLLSNESILVPLLGLFDACTATRHADTDRKMMALMNELTYCLKQAPDLFQFFVEEDNIPHESSSRNIRDLRILSYLYPHIHNPGETGQLARSAVLAILRILQSDQVLNDHIAEKSSFCPVLISGLTAFYYSLPQKLFAMFGPGWHRINDYDVTCSQDLQHFTEYVEFCNAAMQLSHVTVQLKITSSFKELFLIPVVTPALVQFAADELIASMAYFDYILRTLQDQKLRASVLDYLMITNVNDRFIIDHLVGYILHANTRVATVAVALFQTLLDINYYPLLDNLILRYIRELRPFIPSRSAGRNTDVVWNNLALADEILASTPECCQLLSATIGSQSVIDQQQQAASPNVIKKLFGRKQQPEKAVTVDDAEPLLLPSYTMYLLSARYNLKECWKNFDFNETKMSVKVTSEGVDTTDTSDLPSRKTIALFPDLELHGVNVFGPFMAGLLFKLDHMLEHDIYFNLQLTGLISRVLMFPQEELWYTIFGKHDQSEMFGRSLLQIIGYIKSVVDSTLPSSPLGKAILERAYRSLLLRTVRADSPTSDAAPNNLPQQRPKMNKPVSNKTSDSNMVESIFNDGDVILESVEMTGAGPKYSRRNSAPGGQDVMKLRIAAYTAVLLNEFVQEIAAICQERVMIYMMSSCE